MASSIASLLFSKSPTYFLQTTVAECGLACLGIVASHHGFSLSMRELRNRHPVSLHGMTVKRVLEVAEQMNFSGRALRLEPDELTALRLPAVLHWDMSHFVVLLKAKRGSITIFDPSVGRRKMALQEFAKHFTGVAIELWPNQNFKKENRLEPAKLSSVLGAISGLTSSLGSILLLSFVLSAAALLAPLQTQLIIDQAVTQTDFDLLFLIIAGFACLSLFSAFGAYIRGYLSLKLTQALSLGMQSNLTRQLLSLPLRYFQSRHIGDLLNKLEGAGSVQNFLMSGAVAAIVDGLMAILTLVLLFTYGANLALLTLASIFSVQFVDLNMIAYRKHISHEIFLASGRENTLLVEMISGVQALKLSSKESNRLAVWVSSYSQLLTKQSQLATTNLSVEVVQNVLETAFNAFILYILVSAVISEQLTVGMMISFLAYKSYFSGAFNNLVNTLVDYRMLAVPLEQLADIVSTAPEPVTGQKLPLKQGTIRFEDVWFRYDEGLPYILQGATFEIGKSEHVALSGVSGAGKSTVLKLLLRALKPERGEIYIDGSPLSGLNLHSYREQLGVVMQDDQLFSGSLMENISMFDDVVDNERLEWATDMACLSQDIEVMPMGIMTMVGDMGSALSGGQKQRVILARALYRKPRILFTDEATSHLDPAMELNIVKNLTSLEMTRFTIAHREETLKSADRILQLDNGIVTPARTRPR
jgi:ATP-binding cassette, subfamily B, bacterial CvaB/MchF/RaxB